MPRKAKSASSRSRSVSTAAPRKPVSGRFRITWRSLPAVTSVLQPPPFPTGPPGYALLEADVEWDPGYLELVAPEEVLTFEELGAGPTSPEAFSDVAITTPFRFLGDEGIRVL